MYLDSPYSITETENGLHICLFLCRGKWHFEIYDPETGICGSWESDSDNQEDSMQQAKGKASNWVLERKRRNALFVTREVERCNQFVICGFSRVLVLGGDRQVEKVKEFFASDKDSHCMTDDFREIGVVKANYRMIGAVAILEEPLPYGVFSGDFDPDIDRIERLCDEQGISIAIISHE